MGSVRYVLIASMLAAFGLALKITVDPSDKKCFDTELTVGHELYL